MNWKNRTWRFATGLVVVLIVLIPEMAQLALSIDAIGLKMFMLLFEVQVFTLFAALFSSKFEQVLPSIKHVILYQFIENNIRAVVSGKKYLVTVFPAPAMIMHALVLSAVIGVAHNAL